MNPTILIDAPTLAPAAPLKLRRNATYKTLSLDTKSAAMNAADDLAQYLVPTLLTHDSPCSSDGHSLSSSLSSSLLSTPDDTSASEPDRFNAFALEKALDSSRALQRQTFGTVLVVGVGYVGTHLVERFSTKYATLAFDVSATRCETLRQQFAANENISVINDLDADERTRTFDLALISVSTLLLPDNTVDTTHIVRAVELVAQRARPGSTVVIESSVTVGMTRKLLQHLRSDLGVFVGFSPERVDPGRVFPAFAAIPKVVSGMDDESLLRVQELYSRVFDTVVPVPSLETAEMTKLYENCQRLMLISYVNEMADACEEHGINVFDVTRAAATKPFGYSPFLPSLGAGGHCIPVNPSYLLANCDMPLLRAAAVANRQRPERKAERVAALAKSTRLARADGGEPRVLISGMGFKKGEASLAYAPTVTLANSLRRLGVHVAYVDDYVRSAEWEKIESSRIAGAAPGEALSWLDCTFDAVVVAQVPSAEHRAVFDSLTLCQAVYFTR